MKKRFRYMELWQAVRGICRAQLVCTKCPCDFGFSSVVIEHLESRTLLSNGPYTPAQINTAYNLSSIFKSGWNGSGETIAIIDVNNDVGLLSQANAFCQAYGLQPFNQAGGPKLTIYDEHGRTGSSATLPSATRPKTAAGADQDAEEAMDVEWAHVISPMANIDLVETDSLSPSDVDMGLQSAANLPGVSVVSLSAVGESLDETDFDTPIGHGGNSDVFGITFVQSSGDDGYDSSSDSAISSRVLSVGGTVLSADQAGNNLGQVGWRYSGGGYSYYAAGGRPTYQGDGPNEGDLLADHGPLGNSTNPGSNYITLERAFPDVSWLAADANGRQSGAVDIFDTNFHTAQDAAIGGGTSLAAPMWAGLIADIDTMLWKTYTEKSLFSFTGNNSGSIIPQKFQTQSLLYAVAANYNNAFDDITLGFNGVATANNRQNFPEGYDLVTGLGTPNLPFLFKDIRDCLASYPLPANSTGR